jgi:hypothetical protein
MNKRLKNRLVKQISNIDSNVEFKVGITNDRLLKILIENIRSDPSFDNFVIFTNCLNFFYSTRLQAAVNQNKRALKTKARIIYRVSEYLRGNWEDGLQLNDVNEGGSIDEKKVDKLRKALKTKLGRGSYSFSTKVFHQLNSKYPILDRNVNAFMQKNGYKRGIDFYKTEATYTAFTAKYFLMMNDLVWDSADVNNFDIAIWLHVSNNRLTYFPKKPKDDSIA